MSNTISPMPSIGNQTKKHKINQLATAQMNAWYWFWSNHGCSNWTIIIISSTCDHHIFHGDSTVNTAVAATSVLHFHLPRLMLRHNVSMPNSLGMDPVKSLWAIWQSCPDFKTKTQMLDSTLYCAPCPIHEMDSESPNFSRYTSQIMLTLYRDPPTKSKTVHGCQQAKLTGDRSTQLIVVLSQRFKASIHVRRKTGVPCLVLIFWVSQKDST